MTGRRTPERYRSYRDALVDAVLPRGTTATEVAKRLGKPRASVLHSLRSLARQQRIERTRGKVDVFFPARRP
jgi:transposase